MCKRVSVSVCVCVGYVQCAGLSYLLVITYFNAIPDSTELSRAEHGTFRPFSDVDVTVKCN